MLKIFGVVFGQKLSQLLVGHPHNLDFMHQQKGDRPVGLYRHILVQVGIIKQLDANLVTDGNLVCLGRRRRHRTGRPDFDRALAVRSAAVKTKRNDK